MGVERLDPWSIEDIEDYDRLIEVFGMEPVTEELLKKLPFKNRIFRRKLAFGHRDLGMIIEALEKGEEYAVMSGIKPTGEFHLGTKMTAEQMIYFQRLSSKAVVFYAIADIEAWEDNGLPLEETREIAVDNVADILALGLDWRRCYVYRQSEEPRVMRWGYVFARGLTINLLESIYGMKHIGMYMSALVQVGDILLPQHPDFGGPKPTIVPVGADQDPHIRLTRDLARKHDELYRLIPPASVYHKLQKALTGEAKMSKRDPMSYITLSDSPELVERKIKNAFTGGRETAELQRRLGGIPEICVVYQLAVFHFIEDDERVRKIYEECKSGSRLCGECKLEVAREASKFISKHQEKKSEMLDLARQLLEEKSFSLTSYS